MPEVTGVGGTTFNESSGAYWNPTNDASHTSALSYIPEVAWNDSSVSGSPVASGGGVSIFFAKPSWQAGAGVPGDGGRDVPDVALSGSSDHDGYLIVTNGRLQVVGGTSVGAQTFAGIAALLNHYLIANGVQPNAGLGNINPGLYGLAQTAPAAFHDITSGDNVVAACSGLGRIRGCAAPVGYNAGLGYDQVTGLGSVDAFNLIVSWAAVAPTHLSNSK
jgi:subtilase family serine protease